MRINLATKPLSEVSSEYVVLPVWEGDKEALDPVASDFLKDNPKFGKVNEAQLIYSKARKILLVGLGKPEKATFATLQNWAGTATKQLLKKTKQASMVLPEVDFLTPIEVGQAVAIGIEIASLDPTLEYKSKSEPAKLTNVEAAILKADRGYQDGIKKGQILAEGMNLARRLGDLPPNEMTPTYFLKTAQKIAKDHKLKLTVLTEAQAKKKGMGAFCGVAQGSDEPSYMIALEYKGDLRSKDKWGFVGKGITFDSGGISIKPDSGMHEMKYDMLGAATVLGTMLAIAKLGLKANVAGVMAVTENLPGGKAQKPGDIVRTYSGKTAEIHSTDAEGRLVLVDALTFAQRDLGATKLVDLATLTGAVIVALGYNTTGVMGNNSEFTQQVLEKAREVGEKMWELPMDEEYDDLIKSQFADMLNVGNVPRAAGTIVGAKFLEKVIEDQRPWVHLDIAGTAWDLKQKPFRGVGATGVALKTLINLIS